MIDCSEHYFRGQHEEGIASAGLHGCGRYLFRGGLKCGRCVKRCFSHQSPYIELAASRQHKVLCEKSHMHDMSGQFIHQNVILGSHWVPQ